MLHKKTLALPHWDTEVYAFLCQDHLPILPYFENGVGPFAEYSVEEPEERTVNEDPTGQGQKTAEVGKRATHLSRFAGIGCLFTDGASTCSCA